MAVGATVFGCCTRVVTNRDEEVKLMGFLALGQITTVDWDSVCLGHGWPSATVLVSPGNPSTLFHWAAFKTKGTH